MNDAALVRALSVLRESAFDEDAWESIYREVYPYLLATMYRGLRGNWYLAEEGVQEVMIRVMRNLNVREGSPNPAGIMSYLNATARSVIVDMSRRDLLAFGTRREGLALDEEEDAGEASDGSPNPEQQALTQSALEHLLNSLAGRDRKIVRQLLAGRRIEEIAASLSVSEKTAYNYVSKLKSRVRDVLFPDARAVPGGRGPVAM